MVITPLTWAALVFAIIAVSFGPGAVVTSYAAKRRNFFVTVSVTSLLLRPLLWLIVQVVD